MATEQELVDEILAITTPKPGLVGPEEVGTLMTVAKREIRAKVGADVDFHAASGSENADQALFWLTCLFVKVKTGEIEGARTRINDLEVHPLRDEEDGEAAMWRREFLYYLAELRAEAGGASMFGHRRVARPDRTYGDL